MNRRLLRPDTAKKNFTFQLLYNVVILVIPLIVSPYLTRTMGSTSLGIYTYTYSIAYYFVVFAMLGINKHGQRIIAQRRDNINRLRKTFWSLLVIHLAASFLSLGAYIIYAALLCQSDKNIALIQGIYVFSAALDITWLFYGLEKFKFVAIRNAFVKVLETVCIFAFVKSPDDIGIYTLIMCSSVCLGQIVMLPQVVREIPPAKISVGDLKEHIKPLFTLFAAVVAVTLYTVFDKTLLGILATKDDVAFYEYSDKIVKIPRTFIAIIGTVLFPRACRYAAEKDFNKLEKTFSYCLIVTSIIGFASAFGLSAVAELFTVLYYGESFQICGNVMICMCPVVLIIGFGEAVRQSYIYPLKMDALMVRILSVNAAVNLILSAILIPSLGIYGAVIGTICAEAVGLVAEVWACRKYLSLKTVLNCSVPFAVCGAIMYLCVRLVANYYDGTLTALILQVFVGSVVYMALAIACLYFGNSMTRGLLDNIVLSVKAKLKQKGRK